MSCNQDPQSRGLDDCWNRIGVWSPVRASCPELQHCVHCRNCGHYSAAGRQMLERPPPEDYLEEWTQCLATPERATENPGNSAVVFRLGDEWLAISSHCVNEVTRMRPVHSIPHRNDTLVRGLVSIRGELKICVSLGSLLQLDKQCEPHVTDHEILERMLLIEHDRQSYVFPVSEVEGTMRYADRQLASLPTTLAHGNNKLTTGIVYSHDRHIGILDHELLCYALARGLA
jgi:chemotaxis-related protein WspD